MRNRREERELGSKLTTLTGQTEVGTDVDVPFVVHSTLFMDSLEGILVALPDGSTDFFISICSPTIYQDVHLGLRKRERERAKRTSTRIARLHGSLSESWPIAQNTTCGCCCRTRLCTIQSSPPHAQTL